MAVNPTDFLERFPEFAAVDPARIQFFLDDALCEVGEAAWGTLYEKGVFLLTAHFLVLDGALDDTDDDGTDESRVTSRKVGDVQVSFARASSTDPTEDWYRQTKYGSDYLRLKMRVGMGAVAVGGY